VNPLEQNPAARKIAYQIFWTVSLLVGMVQVGFAAAGADTPTWLTVALSVLPFLGAAIGYTAQANVNPLPQEEAVKLSAVPDQGTTKVTPTTATHLDTPPDDERGVANYDERGVYDGTTLLIAIAAIVVIVCGIIWLLGR
jgi:hypothetical protein